MAKSPFYVFPVKSITVKTAVNLYMSKQENAMANAMSNKKW